MAAKASLPNPARHSVLFIVDILLPQPPPAEWYVEIVEKSGSLNRSTAGTIAIVIHNWLSNA
jgi:hypothetical protein